MAIESINNVTNAYQGSVANVENQAAKEAAREAVEAHPIPGKSKSESNVIAEKGGKPIEITEKVSEEIKKAIDNINKRASNTSAQFSYNEDSNKVTVKIIDVNTDEVIKEFPSEKMLDMISKAFEMVGLVVDESL